MLQDTWSYVQMKLFCDGMTKSIEGLVNITEYRRRRQIGYNERHGIIPESVRRADQESLHMTLGGTKVSEEILADNDHDIDVVQVISELEVEMQEAASCRVIWGLSFHFRDPSGF